MVDRLVCTEMREDKLMIFGLDCSSYLNGDVVCSQATQILSVLISAQPNFTYSTSLITSSPVAIGSRTARWP